jgi:hypothetical protein
MNAAQEIPEEERARTRESFPQLVERLSRQSVSKHFEAYKDIDWDAPHNRIVDTDPRFILSTEDPLGSTAWYQSLDDETKARMGLHIVASFMKVGVQFENVLSRGLLLYAAMLPNRSPEFRYAYHEVIEESQHSLMFQEFLNRTGVDVPGLGGWRSNAGERVLQLGRRFPELFFLFVLGGEDPIDYLQRLNLKRDRQYHPLLKQISQIHITEEARHLCFARQYLRTHVPELSTRRRWTMIVLAPVVLHLMARAMLEPSPTLIARFGVPDHVIDQAWRKNPKHHAAVRDSLGKVRELCDELGLIPSRARRLWCRLGIA